MHDLATILSRAMKYQPYNNLQKILLDKHLKIWYNIMIKYNWEKILEITEGDAGSIIQIVHLLTYPRTPFNYRDPIYKYSGQSLRD